MQHTIISVCVVGGGFFEWGRWLAVLSDKTVKRMIKKDFKEDFVLFSSDNRVTQEQLQFTLKAFCRFISSLFQFREFCHYFSCTSKAHLFCIWTHSAIYVTTQCVQWKCNRCLRENTDKMHHINSKTNIWSCFFVMCKPAKFFSFSPLL